MTTYTVIYKAIVAESPEDAAEQAQYFDPEIVSSKGTVYRLDEFGQAYEVTVSDT